MKKILNTPIYIIFAIILSGVASYGYADDIQAGTMNVIKNLNPYMARSEIELALQKVVFPPVIADFIEGNRKTTGSFRLNSSQNDSFRGILIPNAGALFRKIGMPIIEFNFTESPVSPEVFIKNIEYIKSLGSKTDFSWNLTKARQIGGKRVELTFSKNQILGKLIAASFPVVDFQRIQTQWDKPDQVFITKSDIPFLKGYSDYRYSVIDPTRNIVRVSPRSGKKGKPLTVKSFPDYKQMVDQLKSDELQVAFNISPLTVPQNENIAFDDLKFANQYVLFMQVTGQGKQKGLADMSIINYLRKKFKESFPNDSVLHSSGQIFLRDGFLIETGKFPRSIQIENRRFSGKVSVLYLRNTLNDRVITLLEGVLNGLGFTLRPVAIDQNTPWSKVNEEDFDLVIKSRYVQFPEFLNLRYYSGFLQQTNATQVRSFTRRISRLLSKGGKMSLLQQEARKLEHSLLGNLPIVFFVRYNTRIAVRRGVQKYNSSGVPYFFYNLSNW